MFLYPIFRGCKYTNNLTKSKKGRNKLHPFYLCIINTYLLKAANSTSFLALAARSALAFASARLEFISPTLP